MSYSVYVQKFKSGESVVVPFEQVSNVLSKYGTIGSTGAYLELTPHRDDLCEVAILSGSVQDGVSGISFERPVSGPLLPEVIFQLLAIPGMCFFEVDCTYVAARTDITADLPKGLVEQCKSGAVTVVSGPAELRL